MISILLAVIGLLLLSHCPLYSIELTGSEHYHTAGINETIETVSRDYNIPVKRLLQINKINNPSNLEPGERIRITTPRIVPARLEDGLIINLPEYTVYHFEGGVVVNTYPIAIGMENWQTPKGKFTVISKIVDPTWKIPPRMSRKYNYDKSLIPPGPDNPLGKYWIGLSIPHIGLHSTNRPETVGIAISHGCMRMYLEHAERLYNSAETGTMGEIIYEPVKTTVLNDSVYLEVHDDVYHNISNLKEHVVKLISRHESGEYIDMEKVNNALERKNGVPVNISRNPDFDLDSEKEGTDSKMLWRNVFN